VVLHGHQVQPGALGQRGEIDSVAVCAAVGVGVMKVPSVQIVPVVNYWTHPFKS
jgi:hypothetical protein